MKTLTAVILLCLAFTANAHEPPTNYIFYEADGSKFINVATGLIFECRVSTSPPFVTFQAGVFGSNSNNGGLSVSNREVIRLSTLPECADYAIGLFNRLSGRSIPTDFTGDYRDFNLAAPSL